MPRSPPRLPRIPRGMRWIAALAVMVILLAARPASAQVPIRYGPPPWGYPGVYYPGFGWPNGSAFGFLMRRGRTVYGFGQFAGQGRIGTGILYHRPGFTYGYGSVLGGRRPHAGTFIRGRRGAMFWGY